MPDYKALYVRLFQSQTQAIRILQDAQFETEEMYISSEPADMRLLTMLQDVEAPDPDNPDGNE